MLLDVFDLECNRLGVIDGMESLIWTRRYREVGDCMLLTPFTARHNALLSEGRLLMQHGGTEAMQIVYKSISKDEQNHDAIEVHGQSLLGWLGRRIILGRVAEGLTAQKVMQRLLALNALSPEDARRAIPRSGLYIRPDYAEDALDYVCEEHANLLDALLEIMDDSGMGLRVVTDVEGKRHLFDPYRGRDLTQGGGNPLILSVDYENIGAQTYTHSTENLRTMAYIDGADASDTVGETLAGLDRREIYVAASDIAQTVKDAEGNEETYTEEEVRRQLRQRGQEELAQYLEEHTFDGALNLNGATRYKRDFDLGDAVTCQYARWGISVDVTVTEVTETYQGNVQTISVVLGDGAPSIARKIKQIARSVQ